MKIAGGSMLTLTNPGVDWMHDMQLHSHPLYAGRCKLSTGCNIMQQHNCPHDASLCSDTAINYPSMQEYAAAEGSARCKGVQHSSVHCMQGFAATQTDQCMRKSAATSDTLNARACSNTTVRWVQDCAAPPWSTSCNVGAS